jgi:hypothetical protein
MRRNSAGDRANVINNLVHNAIITYSYDKIKGIDPGVLEAVLRHAAKIGYQLGQEDILDLYEGRSN